MGDAAQFEDLMASLDIKDISFQQSFAGQMALAIRDVGSSFLERGDS